MHQLLISDTLIQSGRNKKETIFSKAEERLGKDYIRVSLRKVKQVSGIKMNNCFICLVKEMAVKNFAKVIKKFYKKLYKFL